MMDMAIRTTTWLIIRCAMLRRVMNVRMKVGDVQERLRKISRESELETSERADPFASAQSLSIRPCLRMNLLEATTFEVNTIKHKTSPDKTQDHNGGL